MSDRERFGPFDGGEDESQIAAEAGQSCECVYRPSWWGRTVLVCTSVSLAVAKD
jgi:hypothetical protein